MVGIRKHLGLHLLDVALDSLNLKYSRTRESTSGLSAYSAYMHHKLLTSLMNCFPIFGLHNPRKCIKMCPDGRHTFLQVRQYILDT